MAASTYFDQVQKLYIAYFGRPADPVGLNYWAANIDAAGGNFNGVIAGFASSSESQALYAAGTTAQLITSIYVALFNRTPEAAGLAYWVSQIDAGTISGARAAYQILISAGPGDAASIANKVTAANFFTANVDTSAELTGYNGATSAAIARAYLSKVDATSYSIANLTPDVITQAVADATGTKVSTPTTPAGPSTAFAAAIDGSNAVTFSNAGAAISVTQAGPVYTFTSGAATATVTGAISSITVPTTSTLTIGSTLASGITFPGTGTVALSDTGAVTASVLKGLEAGTTGLLDASSVTSITSATVADAQLLLVTNQGTSGDKIKTAAAVAVTLTSATATGTALKAIDDATTGVVDASTVTSITAATIAQAKQLLITDVATFTHAANVTVALSETTVAAAADLNSIDAATTGLVTTATTSITGTEAAVQTALEAITAGTTLAAPGLATVTLTSVITAAQLNSVAFANNVTINLADVASNAITLVNTTIGAGKTLTIDGSALTNSFNFNGASEADGAVIIKGGAGADTFIGTNGADTLTGGLGADLFVFTQTGSLIGSGGGTNIDRITDFNTGGADQIAFNAPQTLRAADATAIVAGSGAGSNVQQTAGGKVIFDVADNTLALKVAAVQADAQLNAANTIAFFENGGNTYVFNSGQSTATTDDQLIELTGVTGLTTITAGSSSTIA